MNAQICTVLFVLTAGIPTIYGQTTPPESENRDIFNQWVESVRLISEEENEWAYEKALLENTVALLEEERDSLNATIETNEEQSSEAEIEKANLLTEKEALTASMENLRTLVTKAEASIKSLLPLLPEPLTQEIRPLIARLPEDPERTGLTAPQRVQTVVGLLTQINKFNGAVTVVSEIRELPNGSNSEVKTAYFGLAGAYFVDGMATFAGYGRPSANGWEWMTDASLAEDITQLLKVQESATEATFTSLPVVIQ